MILWADDKIRNTALLLCITFKKLNLDKIPFQPRKMAKNKPVIPDHLTIGSSFSVRTAGNFSETQNQEPFKIERIYEDPLFKNGGFVSCCICSVNKVTYNFLGTKSAAVVMILVKHHISAIAMMMVTSIATVVVVAVKLTCTEDLVTTLHYLILITPDEAANSVSSL